MSLPIYVIIFEHKDNSNRYSFPLRFLVVFILLFLKSETFLSRWENRKLLKKLIKSEFSPHMFSRWLEHRSQLGIVTLHDALTFPPNVYSFGINQSIFIKYRFRLGTLMGFSADFDTRDTREISRSASRAPYQTRKLTPPNHKGKEKNEGKSKNSATSLRTLERWIQMVKNQFSIEIFLWKS